MNSLQNYIEEINALKQQRTELRIIISALMEKIGKTEDFVDSQHLWAEYKNFIK